MLEKLNTLINDLEKERRIYETCSDNDTDTTKGVIIGLQYAIDELTKFIKKV